MPNPLHSENSKQGRVMKRRLTMRQKKIVSGLHSRGLSVRFYRRAGNRNGVSVHDQRADSAKVARRRPNKTVKRYPQAFDTKAQRQSSIGQTRKARASKKRVKKKSPFHAILNP